MKRIGIILGLLTVSVMLYAAPTYMGQEGYIAVPRVDVPYTGRLGLSFKFTGNVLFTPVINFVPFEDFEISAAMDLLPEPMAPLLIGAQYQFVEQAALGFYGEIPFNTGQSFAGTVYLSWEELLSASGVADSSATFSLGYTFGAGQGSNINFAVGLQRYLFWKMYLVADFSNFPYRHMGAKNDHLNESRAILNIGLRLILTDWISIDFAGMDLMDGNRTWMVGGNFYFGK